MNLIDKDKELRTFGLSLGLGLMVISTVLKMRGRPYIYLPPVSVLFVLVALIKPRFLNIIKSLLEKIFKIITNLITGILLIVLFYLIITPLGLIARLFRRRFLKLGFENIPSYFEKRERHAADNKEIYERQF